MLTGERNFCYNDNMKKITRFLLSFLVIFNMQASFLHAEEIEGETEVAPEYTQEMLEEAEAIEETEPIEEAEIIETVEEAGTIEEATLFNEDGAEASISAFLTIDGKVTTAEEILILDQTHINSIVASIHYENIDISIPYNIWIITFYEGQVFDVNLVTDRSFTSETGDMRVSGKWSPWQQEWLNMPAGNYRVEIQFQRTDDTTSGYVVPDSNLVRFAIGGIASSVVALEEKLFSGPYALAKADLETVHRGLYVAQQVNYVLPHDVKYDALLDVYQIKDGEEVLIRGGIQSSFISNTDGYSMMEVGYFDDLELGIYEVRSRFFDTETQEEVFLPDLPDYVRRFEIVDELDIFVDEPSKAKTRIHSYDENGNYLPTSSYQIVDDDGNVVHTFTSSDTFEELDLEEGEYFLEELSAPTGYQKNERIPFTITKAHSYIRGDLHYGTTSTQKIETIDENFFHVFDVKPVAGEEEPTVGYCFFYGKFDPSYSTRFTTDSLVYKEYIADPDVLKSRYLNETYEKEEFYRNMQRVLYYGYPNNYGGLKEKYQLSDLELQYITQEAVHFFTNNKSYDSAGGEHGEVVNQAYNELIELAKDDSFEVPSDLVMYLYIPSNDNYQDILIAQYAKPKAFDLEVTHVKQTRTLSVTKKWENDVESLRPKEITVELYKNGVKTDQTITLSKENNWQGHFEGLIMFEEDKEIKYTVKETQVDGYEGSVVGDMKEGYSITNRYKEKETPTPTPTTTPTITPTPTASPTPEPKPTDKPVVPTIKKEKVEIPYTHDDTNMQLWSCLGILSCAIVFLYNRIRNA